MYIIFTVVFLCLTFTRILKYYVDFINLKKIFDMFILLFYIAAVQQDYICLKLVVL